MGQDLDWAGNGEVARGGTERVAGGRTGRVTGVRTWRGSGRDMATQGMGMTDTPLSSASSSARTLPPNPHTMDWMGQHGRDGKHTAPTPPRPQPMYEIGGQTSTPCVVRSSANGTLRRGMVGGEET